MSVLFRLRWTLAICEDERVPSFDRHLALTLATWMNAEGYCYPGVPAIAWRMGVDERSVQRHLHGDEKTETKAWLPDLGYLRIVPRPGSTHEFFATLPPPAECSPPEQTTETPGTLPPPGTVTHDPRHAAARTTHEPSRKALGEGTDHDHALGETTGAENGRPSDSETTDPVLAEFERLQRGRSREEPLFDAPPLKSQEPDWA